MGQAGGLPEDDDGHPAHRDAPAMLVRADCVPVAADDIVMATHTLAAWCMCSATRMALAALLTTALYPLLHLQRDTHWLLIVLVRSIKLSFTERYEELVAPLSSVGDAYDEVKESLGLRMVLGALLAYGNYMNGGTAKGQADGFNLADLKQAGRADQPGAPRLLCSEPHPATLHSPAAHIHTIHRSRAPERTTHPSTVHPPTTHPPHHPSSHLRPGGGDDGDFRYIYRYIHIPHTVT